MAFPIPHPGQRISIVDASSVVRDFHVVEVRVAGEEAAFELRLTPVPSEGHPYLTPTLEYNLDSVLSRPESETTMTDPAPIDPDLQAAAERSETEHDLAVAAANQQTIDELRQLYNWDAVRADAASIAGLQDEDAIDAQVHELNGVRHRRTRELLGIPEPTEQDLIDIAKTLEGDLAAEAGS